MIGFEQRLSERVCAAAGDQSHRNVALKNLRKRERVFFIGIFHQLGHLLPETANKVKEESYENYEKSNHPRQIVMASGDRFRLGPGAHGVQEYERTPQQARAA